MKATYNFKEFQAALKRVAPAISKDETRPILQCVHIVGTVKRTRLEAADGFRAYFLDIAPADLSLLLPVRARLPERSSQSGTQTGAQASAGSAQADGAQAFDILLESATVKALVSAKVGRKDEPVITLDLETQQVLIDGKVITTRFGEGTYPDVNVIIPTHPAGSITVYPVPFLQAVKRARVFAREGSNVAQLHISESLLVIGKSTEYGQSVNEVSLFKVRIAPLVIAFNADFLIDLLKLCGTEPVKIELTRPNSPALITAADGLKAVIMPFHIENGLYTPPDIRPESDYTGTGYIWPDCYTNRHPDPAALHGGYIPSWYAKPEPWPVSDEERAPALAESYTDDIFTPNPQPGALDWDIVTIESLIEDVNADSNWGRPNLKKVARLYFGNPRPNPEAPIPVEIQQSAYINS